MIIKELALVFNIESESQLKNGDTEYFGSLTCGYLKTYCFLSKIQIETLKKDFKVEYDLKTNIEFKANFWTRSLALKENKYLNIGLIYALKQNPSRAKDLILKMKTVPLLNLVLSDQPEIFYGIKPKVLSYKRLNDFDIYSFKFKKEICMSDREKNSICYQIRNMTSSSEIAEFVFRSNPTPRSKRLIMTHILNYRTGKKGSFEINYTLIRQVHFLLRIFSVEVICDILEKDLDKLLNCPLMNNYMWSGLDQDKIAFGVVRFLSAFTSDKKKINELYKFDIPHHILGQFSEIMKDAYEHFKPDITKSTGALYFFNNLSRDYGRLKHENFTLKMSTNENFLPLISVLDGLKINDWEFKVPKNYHTLLNWGAALCNCAGNFHVEKDYEYKLLVGIFKGNKIVYLVSLKGENYREIGQFKGYKNSDPPRDQLDLLVKPFIPFLTNPVENLQRVRKGIEEDVI